MIRRIDATVLIVNDLETSMRFYRDVLGLEIVVSDPVSFAFRMDNHDFVLLSPSAAAEMVGEAALELNNGSVSGNRVLLCAGVDDVDATYAALTAKGLAFIKPPVDQAWGRRTAYFADPEGNLWELWQSIDSAQS